ncbi:acylneuraminate cytidylyltransferase family protein [Pelagibius sp. 7325]|uniref:acylneuraminate cytidylyltransferase family protein n=1 Tax=Pelagibius sp. 7325 TaxID=3131994 RepID=UPI0030EF9105
MTAADVRLDDSRVLGLIPARGGSKSIPLKNIAPIAGRPMIEYVIAAGKASRRLSMLACSTDHDAIAAVCRAAGVEVLWRPEELGQDDTPVADVMRHVLRTLAARDGAAPWAVALLQPTSPFLLGAQVDACIDRLAEIPDADSAQTITPVFHNAHAFNQRVVEEGRVRFRFLEERRQAYNKQRKPAHYLFGNLVVTRSAALLAGKDCFGDISAPVEIPRSHALDVDTAEDLDYASWLVAAGKVTLDRP